MEATGCRRLLPFDHAALGYLGVVTILVVACRSRVPDWWLLAGAHAGAAVLVVLLVHLSARLGGRLLRVLRFWYPVLLVPAVFRMNGVLVPRVNPADLDMTLLAWDRTLFGGHPAALLGWLESPWVTEILRLCWMSYFVLPFLVAVPLYRRRRHGQRDLGPYLETALALSVGWYVSYLGYFMTPALGPGYYPQLVGTPPAAAGGTGAMLDTLWHLEGAKARDICPSGHVIIALLATWAAFRHAVWSRWLLVPLVTGLVVGTVYLRFHYGVDVLAGAVIAAAIALVVPGLHRRAFGGADGR